jgi:hypothetical protein
MPPLDAIVLVVDEKSHVQALERAQGYRKLPNGRALSGRAPAASGHCAVGNARIVGISYRYFENMCDGCEHKCSDWTSKERERDTQMLALTIERAPRRLPTHVR